MRQLALAIQSPSVPTLDNFVCGRNTEALAALRGLPLRAPDERLMYLWGPPGSGKTHLLQALRDERQPLGPALCQYVDAEGASALAPPFPEWLLIDNIEKGSGALAESVFFRWNQIREEGGALIVSGDSSPTQLPIAPELSSRLAWGQVFQLAPLNDEEKLDALKSHAKARHLPVEDDALHYLLTHSARDLPSLMHNLDALDQLSLSHQRGITIPLIREWLNNPPPESR